MHTLSICVRCCSGIGLKFMCTQAVLVFLQYKLIWLIEFCEINIFKTIISGCIFLLCYHQDNQGFV